MRQRFVSVVDVPAPIDGFPVSQAAAENESQFASTMSVFGNGPTPRNAEKPRPSLAVESLDGQLRYSAPERAPFYGADISSDIGPDRLRQALRSDRWDSTGRLCCFS